VAHVCRRILYKELGMLARPVEHCLSGEIIAVGEDPASMFPLSAYSAQCDSWCDCGDKCVHDV